MRSRSEAGAPEESASGRGRTPDPPQRRLQGRVPTGQQCGTVEGNRDVGADAKALDHRPVRHDEVGHHVKQAVDALLAGKPVPVTATQAYGCSVKYKSNT